jgi:hypothetical protein
MERRAQGAGHRAQSTDIASRSFNDLQRFIDGGSEGWAQEITKSPPVGFGDRAGEGGTFLNFQEYFLFVEDIKEYPCHGRYPKALHERRP